MNHQILGRVLPLGLAVALLGAACTGDGGDSALVDSASSDQPDSTAPPDEEQPTTEETTEPTTETGDEGDDGGGGDSGGGSLGSSTGQHPSDMESDSPVVPLRIEVTGLQRDGEVIELTMTLTNEHEDAAFRALQVFADPELRSDIDPRFDISGVKLVDQGERRAYLPMLDSEEVCQCTYGLNELYIAAGESHELHASFGGIPESVTTLDLEVPGFEPVSGLEVQG
jgi:hypothetical protein